MDSELFLQITDTSLKIGLGALIAAVTAWVVLRRSAPQQSNSLRDNRRLQILEEVSTQVGTVTHIFAKYSSLVVESIQFGDRWPQARRIELESVNTELVAEFKKLAEAEARLLMLGEKNLERSLRLYGAKIAVYRKQVYVGRKDISLEQITALKNAITQVREQFYDMLSRKYDRLLASA
ncbi:energy transducer TonB [Cellvibrio sp. UBA7661]|uniref:energy transducer TonB n=1 Tax=Cellvibrio sp. UBA7661 TaxID=1946311 RepID=UPI002F360E89